MDDGKMQRMVAIAADLGKAGGMRASANIIRGIADGKERVDASELLAVAASMERVGGNLESKCAREMVAVGVDVADFIGCANAG